jgi:hypothetical protein
MELRDYDPGKDKEAVQRIWLETGWLEKEKLDVLDIVIESNRAMVAEVNGEAECLVLGAPGTIRYLDQVLPFFAVTGVTTSRVARKQGLASRLTARMLAASAAEGGLVGGLGMFEQGFYNQLGFGTGGYEHWTGFDPARLQVKREARIPQRITADDWAAVHASRLARMQGHGSCNLEPAGLTRAEMVWASKGFGLGYYDGPHGELLHHIWCNAREVESGPYTVAWTSFRTWEQFLELMALVRNLGDQVRLVRMREPPTIQLQDLIQQPFKQRQVSERSRFETGTRASAYWQMRICDLPGCLERTRLPGGPVRFNLALSDPVERFVEKSLPWHGTGGDYVVSLGRSSGAEPGRDPLLPTLAASVGAFTRMWLGVRPATGLAVTDDLSGPRELLAELDEVLRLPEPRPDWDF